MNPIKLNQKQKDVLLKQLNGKYSPFFASEEDQIALNEVINMAEALMFELDAVEESGNDLIAWFWNKYQEQENQ